MGRERNRLERRWREEEEDDGQNLRRTASISIGSTEPEPGLEAELSWFEPSNSHHKLSSSAGNCRGVGIVPDRGNRFLRKDN